jgi:phosphoglycolate phosphatase
VAWKRAFDELYGIRVDIGEVTDAGMTDPDVGAKTFEAVLHRKSAHQRRSTPAGPGPRR